ncbi:hypothetical protein J437_LFUL009767 [Ladona fulva]|uniref:Uncharacterized protein n=1 Tax=Ladona fulva TaxID=123851 RepID=A0A8K0KCI1_LADFU|nr:hypothetical protein J437_LFUL009767 [Ladona fulva]
MKMHRIVLFLSFVVLAGSQKGLECSDDSGCDKHQTCSFGYCRCSVGFLKCKEGKSARSGRLENANKLLKSGSLQVVKTCDPNRKG